MKAIVACETSADARVTVWSDGFTEVEYQTSSEGRWYVWKGRLHLPLIEAHADPADLLGWFVFMPGRDMDRAIYAGDERALAERILTALRRAGGA